MQQSRSDSNGAKSHVKGRSWDRLASQGLSSSVSQGTIWRYVAVDGFSAVIPRSRHAVVWMVVNGAFFGLTMAWGRLIGDTSAAQRNGLERRQRRAVGIGFRHGDPDVRTVTDLGADLQELPNRLTLSASQGGLLQSETTQGVACRRRRTAAGVDWRASLPRVRSANRPNCCSFMRFSRAQ